MTATAQLFVGTGTNTTGIGTVAWTNPGNITASDDTRAVCTLDGGLVSNYLYGTNPNPSLPKNAYIDGVTCKWEGDYFNTFASKISGVGLIIGGVRVGTEKNPNQTLTSSDVVYTYGSATDKWGIERITPAQVNASNCGFYSYSTGSASGASRTGVDAYSMIFDYTLYHTFLVNGGGGLVNQNIHINGGLARSY